MKKSIQFIVALLILVSATIIVYYPSLQNGFTNWDDTKYVLENDLIRTISADSILNYFKVPVSSNFHPLTIMSLSVDYHFAGEDPFIYHLHNLALHVCNALLVFLFIYLLGKRSIPVAFLTALIFAVHPMHVESVAWISERKDVLYSFWFLLGMILYMFYAEKRSIWLYTLIVVAYVLSAFSKSAAVVFPLCLLLVDLYKTGSVNKRQLAEKIPLFVISLIIGVVALRTQQKAMFDIGAMTFPDRVALASFGYVAYLVKFFVPVNLNALYLIPRPVPEYYYFFLPVTLAILGYGSWRIYKDRSSVFGFGIGFYTATLLLVLQLVTIGMAVIAERYTYMPYVGIGFILATFIVSNYLERSDRKVLRYGAVLLVLTFLIVLSVAARERTKVWKDSDTLWSDALKKDPKNHVAYNNLGQYYHAAQLWDTATYLYTKALFYRPGYIDALRNRAFSLSNLGRYEEAFADISILPENIQKEPGVARVRQLCLSNLGKTEMALEDINASVASGKADVQTYFSRGLVFSKTGEHRKALDDFLKVLAMDPQYGPSVYENIGVCYYNLKDYPEALKNLDIAIARDSMPKTAYYARGLAFMQMKNYGNAISDLTRFLGKDSLNKQGYIYRASMYYMIKEYRKAKIDYNIVIRLDDKNAEAFYNRSVVNYYLGDRPAALSDAMQARSLGYNVPESYIRSLQ